MSYSVVNVDELDAWNGVVHFTRRALGVQAFGINWFALPPDAAGKEHDEEASGQEEVYVVVAGSGNWIVDGESVEVRVGSFLRIDPQTTRQPVAGPEGLTFVAVGAPPGGYQPRGELF